MNTKGDDARGVGFERPALRTFRRWPLQTNPPPIATATRPATTSPAQTSVPNASPPATTTETTGATQPGCDRQKMNEDEKQKVDTEGQVA